MGVDDWREAWLDGRTAFHRDEVHEDLIAHHDEVLAGAERILVPLSGRSLDLAWLVDRGHEVVGVEIVEEVVAAYFAASGADVAPAPLGPFRAYRDGRLTVLAGDMLAATPDSIGAFDGAWDRAALMALSPRERPGYVDVLRALLRPSARVLLQIADCDRPADAGPPYRVTESEIERLYRGVEVRAIGHRPPGPEGWPQTTFRLDFGDPPS